MKCQTPPSSTKRKRALFCSFRGFMNLCPGEVGRDRRAEHGEGDEGIDGAEAERYPGEQAQPGVDRLHPRVGKPVAEGVLDPRAICRCRLKTDPPGPVES